MLRVQLLVQLLLSGVATQRGAAGRGYPSAHTSYPNVPWPLPDRMSAGNESVVVPPELVLHCPADGGCDPSACAANSTLNRAVARYSRIVSPARAPPPQAGEKVLAQTIHICVTHAAELLGPAMNESHTLSVPSEAGGSIRVGAQSQHGALRALESLAHLVSMSRPGRIVNAPVEIEDAPRWPVRGLMVNPAGRFMSIPFLKRVVDGLVVNKMNYLHIHFTDVASFPVHSDTYPQLAAMGRFSRLVWHSPSTQAVYSTSDLKSLVAYAAERGVRVVPEFDMPGHGGWNYGMPEICLTSCPSILDVTKEQVYEVLTNFLGEMSEIFTDPVMMLGGDEVGISCHDPSTGKDMLLSAFDRDKGAAGRMKQLGINSSTVRHATSLHHSSTRPTTPSNPRQLDPLIPVH